MQPQPKVPWDSWGQLQLIKDQIKSVPFISAELEHIAPFSNKGCQDIKQNSERHLSNKILITYKSEKVVAYCLNIPTVEKEVKFK